MQKREAETTFKTATLLLNWLYDNYPTVKLSPAQRRKFNKIVFTPKGRKEMRKK